MGVDPLGHQSLVSWVEEKLVFHMLTTKGTWDHYAKLCRTLKWILEAIGHQSSVMGRYMVFFSNVCCHRNMVLVHKSLWVMCDVHPWVSCIIFVGHV